MLDFTASSLIAGILYGLIGMWMFRVGKRDADLRLVIIGMVLIIYPYFTHGPLQDWGIGAALCGLAYYIWDT